MSENDGEKSTLEVAKRETLGLKNSMSAGAVGPVPEAQDGSSETRSTGKSKKAIKDSPKIKTTTEIFKDAFSVLKDKEGNVKPARIPKADLKSLCSVEKVDKFGNDIIDKLCRDAEISDSGLDCLTEIILNILELKHDESRTALFNYCMQLASGVWINKHRGNLDLFEDIFQDYQSQEDAIQFMEKSLNSMFDKRISSLVKVDNGKNSDPDVVNTGNAESSELQNSVSEITKNILIKQHKNLLIVGVLWLLEKARIGPEVAHSYFLSRVDKEANSKATSRDVSIYLASQCLMPEARFIRVVSILRYQIRSLEEEKSRLERLLKQKDQQISQIAEAHMSLRQEAERARHEISDYQTEVAGLKRAMEDQKLDERATRTHLRASEGKVRAKAFNLLSEDVLEPLKLSLAALRRENPKTEVAAHQVELVVESIERDLSWFKE